VTKAPRILYFSSLFPSPTHPHSGPFSLRRVQALIQLGSGVRVVCPIGLTPPKQLSLHPLLAARWVKQERSIPLEATIEERRTKLGGTGFRASACSHQWPAVVDKHEDLYRSVV